MENLAEHRNGHAVGVTLYRDCHRTRRGAPNKKTEQRRVRVVLSELRVWVFSVVVPGPRKVRVVFHNPRRVARFRGA